MAEWFSYSILINNPLLSLALNHKYAADIYEENQHVIYSLLNYLNEFSEENRKSQYKRLECFEQYLYLADNMMSYFSYYHAEYFIKICERLLKLGIEPEK